MVSKTSTAGTAKKSTASAGKKTATKSATKKTSAAKVKSDKKLVNQQVPVKENIDPVEKVLEIKAKNESKKSAKIAQKPAKVKEVSVKSNKEPVAEKKCPICACKCKDGICGTWARAYRNMFNFKGRTSRYEFWGFILLNFIFATLMVGAFVGLISASATSTIMTAISLGGMAAFILIEVITYFSLLVRRLHDTGNTAWKGFFRPTILSIILLLLLYVGCIAILGQLGERLFDLDFKTQLCLSGYLLAFLISIIFVIFYITKLILIASFADEDDNNVYGDACYNGKLYKAKAFKYAILYCTLITICNLIAEQVGGYFQYGQY